MEEQRILVPYDGSLHARHALLEAIQLARTYPARLRIIYVMETMPWAFGNDTAPGDLWQAFETLVNPHLAAACEAKGMTYIEFNLLADNPCPGYFSGNPPLRSAVLNLKQFYIKLFEKERFKAWGDYDAVLLFSFNLKLLDHYCSICTVTINTTNGKVFEKTVDCSGKEVTRAAHNFSLGDGGQGRVLSRCPAILDGRVA